MIILDHTIRDRSETSWRCAGFTLIEIMVIVVILAIAALVAIPAFSGAAEMQVRAAAEKLAADMEYAKSLAVTTQQNHKVVFDIGARSYQLRDADNLPVKDPVKRGNFNVVYSQEGRLNQVSIAAVSFNGTATVQFNHIGAPLDGSGTPLSGNVVHEVILAAGGHHVAVRVEPATGYISIH